MATRWRVPQKQKAPLRLHRQSEHSCCRSRHLPPLLRPPVSGKSAQRRSIPPTAVPLSLPSDPCNIRFEFPGCHPSQSHQTDRFSHAFAADHQRTAEPYLHCKFRVLPACKSSSNKTPFFRRSLYVAPARWSSISWCMKHALGLPERGGGSCSHIQRVLVLLLRSS